MDLTFWDPYERAIMDRLIPHIRSGRFRVDTDGKIRLPKHAVVDIPWVFVRGRDFGDCYLYMDTWFDVFKIIPAFCQNYCWKVMIQPRTVKELFETLETLRSLNRPSKCGIETRPFVKAQYHGVVYSDSFEGGQYWYKIVREQIPEDIPVLLKRGCTEYEQQQPSNEWNVDAMQREIETRLMQIFVTEPIPPYQPMWIINNVKRSWIFHAWKMGDETYKELIPEEDWNLFPSSLEYQNLTPQEEALDGSNAEQDQRKDVS